jgi:hypothetical protein
MFEDYDRGEKAQKAGMFQAKLIIFAVLTGVVLIAIGISKWSSYSLHKKLGQRHEETTASFINVYPNGRPPNVVYVITYTFVVNGKGYKNTAETRINPKYPRGIVYYNPDDPEENELQPISP